MIYTNTKNEIDNASQCIVCGQFAQYQGFHPDPAEGTRQLFYGVCGNHIDYPRLIGDQVKEKQQI